MKAASKANAFLEQVFLAPLSSANESDPSNAALSAECAYWAAKRGNLFDSVKTASDDRLPPKQEQRWRSVLDDSGRVWEEYVRRAQELDPRGPGGYWIAYHCRSKIFAPRLESKINSGRWAPQRDRFTASLRDQHILAANNIDKVTQTDPTNARLCFLLAEALFKNETVPEATAKAPEKARQARELDEAEPDPRRKLSDQQRDALNGWLFKELSH